MSLLADQLWNIFEFICIMEYVSRSFMFVEPSALSHMLVLSDN